MLLQKMMLFFFLVSFLADVWASHSKAQVGSRSVALLDNYHRMESPDSPLDENTKMALHLTIELGCRDYAERHSSKRYESEAIASRVFLAALRVPCKCSFLAAK